jgi:UDP-N-acetylglucosamine 1-carboxyvinyltransferase
LHLSALEALGANIELEGGYVIAKAPKGLTGAKVTLAKVSVGATHNALMAAVLARGDTVIENAALANFLSHKSVSSGALCAMATQSPTR